MNRTQQTVYIVVLLLLLSSAHANFAWGQGKLGRVRDAVRHSKPAKPVQNNSRPSDKHRDEDRHSRRQEDRRKGQDRARKQDRHQDYHRQRNKQSRRRDCDSGFQFRIGRSFAPAVREVHVIHHDPAPIIPTPVVVQTPEPVYQPVVASVIEQPIVEGDWFVESADSFAWGVRLTAVGGTDFDNIAHGSFGLLLQAPGGPGLDTSVTMLRESGMSFRDHLFLGDVNVVYEPIVTENFRMRLGLGINWLGDSYGGDAGFNMTSGFDLRLTDRIMATGEIDFGSVGDTDITHAQISLGRALNQTTEWTVGYDHLDIGGVTIGSAFTGLRFRF
ncbi:hypothetical protein [Mariniblastus fucicola]|uniref:Outer membrane protein beta-barrel domain-containing protein n=1 Tax=Mariniblastus fucicola TaxID=980251 RepID=A0A5B9PBW0_9BACT|nr:hypothetical protein [Mariniblastus fucicola]QEG22969.1 hypothetical protein MFFC18_28600 [Mariniblastus fucicola]